MKTLYFDCFSGISGDMTIGALLDLGLEFEYLKAELKKLPVEGYDLSVSRVVRSNLSAMKFDVLMEGEGKNRKDVGQFHGHEHHDHHHEDHHNHEERGHIHFHRKASEILSMIEESSIRPRAKQFAT